MLLPFSYGELKDKIKYEKLSSGLGFISIDDPKAKTDSFAVNIPGGTFNEFSLKLHEGTAYMTSSSFITQLRKGGLFLTNRTSIRDPEGVTFSSKAIDVQQGAKEFFEKLTSFLDDFNPVREKKAMTYK